MKSILYINQNLKMVEKITPLLDEGGYKLISVPDGASALKLMESEPVIFVMYDVEAALRGGAGPFLELKAKYPNLPVVAVTPIKKQGEAFAEEIRRKTKFDVLDGETEK
ncbi:MAG: hypothetical protein M1269_00130 [Chloroflexi bacterium]|nr:hypothetical protein [Chloroflexota bacterium]